MIALLSCSLAWGQDPAVPAAPPTAPRAQAGEPAPEGYQPIPVACKTEAACSNYETYKTCEAATCDFLTDTTLVARQVCKKENFTAWCVKPLEPPHSTMGACICDSGGSPAGGWLVGVALAFVARQRRTASAA